MSVTEAIAAAKKAEQDARSAAAARLEEIRTERENANAKWAAETKAIKESLRVRIGGPRKLKPGIEAKEQKAASA